MKVFNYEPYHEFILNEYNSQQEKNYTKIAKKLIKEYDLDLDPENARRVIGRIVNKEANSTENESGIKQQADELGVDLNEIKHGWIKSKEASFFFTNPTYKSREQNAFVDDLLAVISERSPSYPIVERIKSKEGHLLVVNPADIHIGKLATAFETGEDYNTCIAVQRVHEGVQGILDKSSGFKVEQIVFVGGNDILHIDTPKRQTTSGTPQDTDGMWYQNFMNAFKLYVDVLEKLIVVANVHFVYCPSNHDYTNGFFLCQAVEQYFRNNDNITFDCSIAHRKYYTYGLNLIGFTHGDGGKQSDLPLAMAHESKDWVNCKHRYVYTHHLHHKVAKDFMSVCVETMRSPSGTDSWHHRNLYQHAPKAVEGFLHHKDFGQICRFNHIF